MITLRPHHLLCTQAYEGMGYSEEFVKNMDEKIRILREEHNYKIQLKLGLDNLCSHCPGNKGTSCESQEKVSLMDRKVCEYFNLKEGTYIYKDLVEKIKKEITKEILSDICKECEWLKSGRCVELIFN